jgi:predicted O-methyltransferase YrrM
MPELQRIIMQKLYRHDVWDRFTPDAAPGEVEGWNGSHPSLARLTQARGNATVVDVGVWKGQSTITMARAMKTAGVDGCVIAVDTFLGSAEHWDTARNLFTRSNGFPNIYQTFLANVHAAGITDYVVPMPQTSVNAAMILRQLRITASVIHVDAAHEYESVLNDAQEYWNILAPGGYLIGDDYHPSWPGVIRAAGELSARLCRPLSIESPKWILQKPALDPIK